MSRGTDPIKLKEWTEQLARFDQSNQTVAESCLDEEVSEGTFYHWKRRLTSGDRTGTMPQHRQRTGANNSANDTSGFQPVVVAPPENTANVKAVSLVVKSDPAVA